MIDSQIIDALFEAWVRDETHPHRGRVQRPLPSASIVKLFVEAAFYASLKQEERRPLAFSAVSADEAEITGSHHCLKEVLSFSTPIPFTASTIPKIAPAFDPVFSSLAVGARPPTGELICWGGFGYTPTAHRYNQLPVGVPGGWASRPDCLTVSTNSPGALTFSRGDAVLGYLANGYFVPATPTPFTSRSLGKYLLRLIQKTDTWIVHETHYWHHARDAVEVLLGEVSRRGHGGTIVIVDASGPPPGPDVCTLGHALNGEQRLGVTSRRCLETENEKGELSAVLAGLAYAKLAFEILQRTAQLASVDGALILNSAFDVLGFGARLTAPQWSGVARMGQDGFGASSNREFDIS